MTTAADVDRLDQEYLTLLATPPEELPPLWGVALRKTHESRVAEAAARLVDAITDHDLAAYGHLTPEEQP